MVFFTRLLSLRALPSIFHQDGAELGNVKVHLATYDAFRFSHPPHQQMIAQLKASRCESRGTPRTRCLCRPAFCCQVAGVRTPASIIWGVTRAWAVDNPHNPAMSSLLGLCGDIESLPVLIHVSWHAYDYFLPGVAQAAPADENFEPRHGIPMANAGWDADMS